MYLPARPRFEIVVGTASAAERRLVTVATVRALTGLSEGDAPDATLNLLIDGALAQCATYCKLARAGIAPLTLAQETVRTTWPAGAYDTRWWTRGWFLDESGTQLLLPWRAPIRSIDITEGDADLEENVDYQLLGAGVVQRLTGAWAAGGIVADYTAGWVVPVEDPSAEPADGEPMPADLVARVVDQVRLAYDQRGVDLTLRSEDVPNVWSGTYNVPGGDSISASGLLRSLEAALAPYRAPPSFA